MLFIYEHYAASLIFFAGGIHQNELLPRFHVCRQGDEPRAEIQQKHVCFFLKRVFVPFSSIYQDWQVLARARRLPLINWDRVKTISAALAAKRTRMQKRQEGDIEGGFPL
jgi:hypothetical protein